MLKNDYRDCTIGSTLNAIGNVSDGICVCMQRMLEGAISHGQQVEPKALAMVSIAISELQMVS